MGVEEDLPGLRRHPCCGLERGVQLGLGRLVLGLEQALVDDRWEVGVVEGDLLEPAVPVLEHMPLWAGVVGDTLGGLTTDWLLVKTGRTKLARRLVAIVGMLGCAVFIVPAALADNAYTAVFCLTGAMFFLECTIGPSWAVPMHVGGQYSGTVSGMMNMAGNIGGALSPVVFGFLVQYGSWQAPFIVAAALLVTGAAIWAFWLDPEKSVIERR